MATEKGYIKIYRGIFEEDAYNVKFSPAAAWVDLLLTAEFEDGRKVFHRGQELYLKRGQVFGSVEDFTQRWKMTTKEVRNLFIRWETRKQIIRPFPKMPIVEICNYDTHQICDNDSAKNSQNVNFTNLGQSNGQSKLHFWGNQNCVVTNNNSEDYNFQIYKKGNQNNDFGAIKWAINNKELINNISLTTPPAHTHEEKTGENEKVANLQNSAYLEDALYKQLATQQEWLNVMAMHFFYENGKTAEEMLQNLYAAIKEFRAECFRDGHIGHSSLGDLQQHINRTLQNKRQQKNEHSNGNNSVNRGARKSNTPPSAKFTDQL